MKKLKLIILLSLFSGMLYANSSPFFLNNFDYKDDKMEKSIVIDCVTLSFDYVTRLITATIQPNCYTFGTFYMEACNGNPLGSHSCITKHFLISINGGIFTMKAPLRSTSTDTGVVVNTGPAGYSWYFEYP